MTAKAMYSFNRPRSHECGPLLLVVVTAILLGAPTLIGVAGYRINLTPSAALGLWQILPLQRAAKVGDRVFVCPPDTPMMREAFARGYLRRGLCAGGVAPLIKSVAAVAGQKVEIGTGVFIDGQPLLSSRPLPHDASKRPLHPYQGGVIALGHIYLHSEFPGSFDSRYFGPISTDTIVGLAQEIWTYAP